MNCYRTRKDTVCRPVLALFSLEIGNLTGWGSEGVNNKSRFLSASPSCHVHGCMVYTERAEINSLWQQILVAGRITCERSESARERRIALYKSDQYISIYQYVTDSGLNKQLK